MRLLRRPALPQHRMTIRGPSDMLGGQQTNGQYIRHSFS
jgi:hypothetical protein